MAEAAERGARLVVLPEKWNLIDVERRQVAGAEPLDGQSLAAARDWAVAHGIALVAGSVSEMVPGADRAYNTSVLIQPDGSVIAVYRKLHLFDVEVGGHTYRGTDGAIGDTLGRTTGCRCVTTCVFPSSSGHRPSRAPRS